MQAPRERGAVVGGGSQQVRLHAGLLLVPRGGWGAGKRILGDGLLC